MAATTVKNHINELQAQMRKLADTVSKERERQLKALEVQLEKIKKFIQDEMMRQKDHLDKLNALQGQYKTQATSSIKKQLEKARKAAGDARKSINSGEAKKSFLEAQIKVLKATSTKAKSLTKVITDYEKELEKELKKQKSLAAPAPKKATAKKTAKKPAVKKAAAKKPAVKKVVAKKPAAKKPAAKKPAVKKAAPKKPAAKKAVAPQAATSTTN